MTRRLLCYRLSLSVLSLAMFSLLGACDDGSKSASGDASPRPSLPNAIGTSELSAQERRVPLTAVRECNLERVNGTPFSGAPVSVARSGSVVLSGWAVDAGGSEVPSTLDVRLVSKTDNRAWKAQAHTGGARADVKALLGGSAAFANPGFAATLDPSMLPPGTYRAYVVFESSSGEKSCDNGRSITVE